MASRFSKNDLEIEFEYKSVLIKGRLLTANEMVELETFYSKMNGSKEMSAEDMQSFYDKTNMAITSKMIELLLSHTDITAEELDCLSFDDVSRIFSILNKASKKA